MSTPDQRILNALVAAEEEVTEKLTALAKLSRDNGHLVSDEEIKEAINRAQIDLFQRFNKTAFENTAEFIADAINKGEMARKDVRLTLARLESIPCRPIGGPLERAAIREQWRTVMIEINEAISKKLSADKAAIEALLPESEKQ